MTYAGRDLADDARPIVLDRGPHTVLVRIPWPDRSGPLLSGVAVTSTGPAVDLCVTSRRSSSHGPAVTAGEPPRRRRRRTRR